jgi:hypothetical protein
MILLSSDDDDIWIRPRTATRTAAEADLPHSAHCANTQNLCASSTVATRTRSRQEAPNSSRAQRSMFEAEAEEFNSHRRKRHHTNIVTAGTIFCRINNPTVSDKSAESSEGDDSFIATSCDESDENAVDMYHSAVHGMRNAQTARQQLRACTTSCPVCAKFAAYLQHFI